MYVWLSECFVALMFETITVCILFDMELATTSIFVKATRGEHAGSVIASGTIWVT